MSIIYLENTNLYEYYRDLYKNKIIKEVDIGRRVNLNMKLKKRREKRTKLFEKLKEV